MSRPRVVARARYDGPNDGGAVLDVEPVADVLPLAVDRKTLPFEHVQDHEGGELFEELVGAVVVRAVREGDGEVVGVVVGAHEVVGGSL